MEVSARRARSGTAQLAEGAIVRGALIYASYEQCDRRLDVLQNGTRRTARSCCSPLDGKAVSARSATSSSASRPRSRRPRVPVVSRRARRQADEARASSRSPVCIRACCTSPCGGVVGDGRRHRRVDGRLRLVPRRRRSRSRARSRRRPRSALAPIRDRARRRSPCSTANTPKIANAASPLAVGPVRGLTGLLAPRRGHGRPRTGKLDDRLAAYAVDSGGASTSATAGCSSRCSIRRRRMRA